MNHQLRPGASERLERGGWGVEATYSRKECGENDPCISLKFVQIVGVFDNPPPICPPMVIPE